MDDELLEKAREQHKKTLPIIITKMFQERQVTTGSGFIMYNFNDYWTTLINLPKECFR